MFRATIRSLAAHKLRLALTGIAIVLGVAFMAGTFVLTDTIKHTFDTLFRQTAVGKDVVVRAVAPFGSSGGGPGGFDESRPPVPDSLLATVKAVPGVRVAEGSVRGTLTLIGSDGKALHKQAPVIATSWTTERSLSSLTLASGRGPAAPDEVVLDVATAADTHLRLGDKVTLITKRPPRAFTLVGTTKFGSQNNLAGASLVSFTTASAQDLIGTPGFFDQINIGAGSAVSGDAVLSAVGNAVGTGVNAGRYEAVSGSAAAAAQAKSVESFLVYFNAFLLTFALIALFVGAFLIANTFSILIGQRTRELALLRAVGASRSQVTRSMLGEALATGLLGSVAGIALGVPLAAGLYALLKAFGLGLPSSALEILPRTIIVSMLAGTLITLGSAVGPAIRGSRIPPVAAMRDDIVVAETSLRRRAIVGGGLGGLGLAALFAGLFGRMSQPLPLVGTGAAFTFVGVATLTPFVAGRIAHVIGAPLPAAFGITGRLAQANATRNPKRTASTASALMVGLGVVAAIATLGSSITASFGAVIDRSVKADFVITAGHGGFSRAAESAVRGAPGVAAFSPYSEISFHDRGAAKRAAAIDPVTGPALLTLSMVTGSAAALGHSELLVDDTVARNRHLKVGDVIPMGFVARGRDPLPVTIGGTYRTNQFLDNYLVSHDLAAANTDQLVDELIFVNTTAQAARPAAGLAAALSAYPNLSVKTAAQFKSNQKKQFNTLLSIVYVLLALSIVIAAFSVVNTMALSVIERTREIGVLRSIGEARRQVRAMIRGEAVVVSLFGALTGLVLGVGLGAAMVAALGRSGSGIDKLVVPVPTILVVLVLAAVIGVVAAVFPARRAARLDVLRAIATV